MNAAKNKGDRGEREAVEILKQIAPDLVVPNAQRKLGAGRKEDTGDLVVFDDVTIQVKCFAEIGRALYAAAAGAAIQGQRAGSRWSVGMVPIPRARKDSVRWLCIAQEWPSEPTVYVPTFSSPTKAVEYIVSKDQVIGIPSHARVARVARADHPTVLIAPAPVWVESLRLEHVRPRELAS